MYRTIETKIWKDAKFRGLSHGSRLLFIYLLTSRWSHATGLYYIPIPLIQVETGIADVESCMDELVGNGMVEYDHDTHHVWVINMFTYQSRSPKIIKSATTHLDESDTILASKFANFYRKILDSSKEKRKYAKKSESSDTVPLKEIRDKREEIRDKKAESIGGKARTRSRYPMTEKNRDQLGQIRAAHCKAFNRDETTRVVPSKDTERVAKVLEEYGLEKCLAAVRGHRRHQQKNPNPNYNQWVHAFPAESNKEKLEVNWTWLDSMIELGEKKSDRPGPALVKRG